MKRTATAIIMAIFLLALPAMAQAFQGGGGPGGPGGGDDLGMPRGAWWQQQNVVKDLGLTKGQQEKIESLTLAHRREMIKLRAELELKEIDLDPLLSANKLDGKAINQKVDEIEAVRSRISKSRMTMLVEIRKVLTREQYLKLKQLRGRDKRRGTDQRRDRRKPGAQGSARNAPPRGATSEVR